MCSFWWNFHQLFGNSNFLWETCQENANLGVLWGPRQREIAGHHHLSVRLALSSSTLNPPRASSCDQPNCFFLGQKLFWANDRPHGLLRGLVGLIRLENIKILGFFFPNTFLLIYDQSHWENSSFEENDWPIHYSQIKKCIQKQNKIYLMIYFVYI